ncbi:MAG TPA: YceI family protein [Bryobacteraceae bacterium]|nr:YceI family protein [Bryobacteraceae bacterium]
MGSSRYVIDAGSSRFTVRAFVGGMLSSLGHNPTIAIRDFRGEVNFDPANSGQSSLRMQIRADSLEVTDDIKSSDRREITSKMNEDVLASGKFPNICFESNGTSTKQLSEGRFEVKMNGKLSLRGAAGTLPVTAQIALFNDTLRASGEFSLLQSNYRIPLVRVAGGVLKLKDELKFTFDIVARKQE